MNSETLLNVLAVALAAVIAIRCVRVIHNMNPSKRNGIGYFHWLAFGISYGVLCIAAIGAALHICNGTGIIGDWLWLGASTGLILFDRRARRDSKTGSRPDQVVQFMRGEDRRRNHEEKQQMGAGIARDTR